MKAHVPKRNTGIFGIGSVVKMKISAQKKIMLSIGRVFFGIVLFCVLITSSILIAQSFGASFDTVISPSMSPDIPVGSLVISVPTDFAEIELGDDVTYRIGSSKVTHRVIGKDPDAKLLYTQGIANKDPDGAVSSAQLIGRVAVHIPLIGYVLLFLSTLQGKIIVAVILVALAVISVLLETAAKSVNGGD